jgi:integral membrane protein
MNHMEKTFRKVAIAEGWSFIILLGIAMPLKYLANIPEAVKYVGWLHGVLFVIYCFLLIRLWLEVGWKFPKVLLAFVVSLIPFGTFWFERKYLR